MTDELDGLVSELQDEYTLLGELGHDGNAVIYRARHRADSREVMIKVVSAASLESTEAGRVRLAYAAESVARLQHPNIIPVQAIRLLKDGDLALVMPHVPMRSLRQAVNITGAFSPEAVELVLADVASALSYALTEGVVHHDLSPDSIFLELGSRRALLLGDFGIAFAAAVDCPPTDSRAASAHLAPEQRSGAEADARANVYSLGLVAWELLTGTRPSSSEGVSSTPWPDELPVIDSVRPNAVPMRLQYIVERMLRKESQARWAGADGLLAALYSWVVPADWEDWEASHRLRLSAAELTRPSVALPASPTPEVPLPFERPEKADAVSSAEDVVATESATATVDAPMAVVVKIDAIPRRRPARQWWMVAGAVIFILATVTTVLSRGDGDAGEVGVPRSGNPFAQESASDTARQVVPDIETVSAEEGGYSEPPTLLRAMLADSRVRISILGCGFLAVCGFVWSRWRARSVVGVHSNDVPLFGGLVSESTDDTRHGAPASPRTNLTPRRLTPIPTIAVDRRGSRAGSKRLGPERRGGRRAGPAAQTMRVEGVNGPAPDAAYPPDDQGKLELADMPGTTVNGHLVRYSVPREGSRLFLPGRLVISSGLDNGNAIRFVRSDDTDDTAITFGSGTGEPYRHIQLEDETIGRTHARMEMIDGNWHLLNLARTPAVIHNGEVMALGEERQLGDGDLIEMGEVLFTFRNP